MGKPLPGRRLSLGSVEGGHWMVVICHPRIDPMNSADFFHRTAGRRHWINLLFIVVLATNAFFGAEEGLRSIWPDLVLLLIFLVQFFWPTVIGWAVTIGGWLVFAVGVAAYERF